MSDGEGLERVWSFLSPLIRPLRYATKQRRLVSLNLRTLHHNETHLWKAGELSEVTLVIQFYTWTHNIYAIS